MCVFCTSCVYCPRLVGVDAGGLGHIGEFVDDYLLTAWLGLREAKQFAGCLLEISVLIAACLIEDPPP